MTTPDPTALVAAARQRSHDTRQRATDALRRLDATGQTITFTGVAQTAGVSRSWLYRQPDLRDEIDRLRTTRPTTTAAVPAAQRASTDSLRRRLETTLDEIQRLTTENRHLREQVAQRFGQERADAVPGPTSATCPPPTTAATAGPADARSR